jgi:hypothetical protein
VAPGFRSMIEGVLWCAGAVSAVLAAWFEFRHRWQTSEERAKTQTSYAKWWRVIDESRILDLPELVLARLLNYIQWAMRKLPRNLFCLLWTLTASHTGLRLIHARALILVVTSVTLFTGGLVAYPELWWTPLIMLFYMYLGQFPHARRLVDREGFQALKSKRVAANVSGPLASACAGYGLLFFVSRFTREPQLFSLFDTALMLVYSLCMIVALAHIAALNRRIFTHTSRLTMSGVCFGFGVAAGYFATVLALLIGRVAEPGVEVPKTLQLLITNIVCDGLTLGLTVMILRQALPPRKRMPVLLALPLGVLVAAILAFASLYFGMLGSSSEMSLSEVSRVFVAIHPREHKLLLGPRFWLMHTTFLPIAVYSCILALCIGAKVIVLPFARVLRRGSVLDSPHQLSASGLALIAAILFVLAGIVARL